MLCAYTQKERDLGLGKDVDSVVLLRELDVHLIPKQDTIDCLWLPPDKVAAMLYFLTGIKTLFHPSLALSPSDLTF